MQDRTPALAATSVASFLVPFMMSAVGISLPAVQAALSATAVDLSWVEGGYMLSLAVVLLPIGRIADIAGRKRIFIWGTIWFIMVTLLASLAWSIEALLVLRVLQGIGAAMINSTGLAMVTALYPPAERGKAMGIIVGCVYAGLSIGPLLGGLITSALGWRAVFYLCFPLGVVALLLANRIGQEWRPAKGERFDLLGTALYAGFVVCTMKGLTGASQSWFGFTLLLLAVLLGVLFVLRALRIDYPILDVTLFIRNRVFSMSSLATMINYSGTFVVAFLLSLYLQVVRGFVPVQAGTVLIIQPVVQALLSPVAGILSDRLNAAAMATAGMGLCGLGLLGFSFLDAQSDMWIVEALLALMGMGFALFASPNMSVVMGCVAKRHYRIASSLVATMRTFGMSLSMGISTVVFSIYMHGMPVGPENAPLFLACMQVIFGSCTVMAAVGMLCSLGRFGEQNPEVD